VALKKTTSRGLSVALNPVRLRTPYRSLSAFARERFLATIAPRLVYYSSLATHR
jgi:hypothetical protein